MAKRIIGHREQFDAMEVSVIRTAAPNYPSMTIEDAIKLDGGLDRWLRGNPWIIKDLSSEHPDGNKEMKDLIGDEAWDLLQDALEIAATDGIEDAFHALDDHRKQAMINEGAVPMSWHSTPDPANGLGDFVAGPSDDEDFELEPADLGYGDEAYTYADDEGEQQLLEQSSKPSSIQDVIDSDLQGLLDGNPWENKGGGDSANPLSGFVDEADYHDSLYGTNPDTGISKAQELKEYTLKDLIEAGADPFTVQDWLALHPGVDAALKDPKDPAHQILKDEIGDQLKTVLDSKGYPALHFDEPKKTLGQELYDGWAKHYLGSPEAFDNMSPEQQKETLLTFQKSFQPGSDTYLDIEDTLATHFGEGAAQPTIADQPHGTFNAPEGQIPSWVHSEIGKKAFSDPVAEYPVFKYWVDMMGDDLPSGATKKINAWMDLPYSAKSSLAADIGSQAYTPSAMPKTGPGDPAEKAVFEAWKGTFTYPPDNIETVWDGLAPNYKLDIAEQMMQQGQISHKKYKEFASGPKVDAGGDTPLSPPESSDDGLPSPEVAWELIEKELQDNGYDTGNEFEYDEAFDTWKQGIPDQVAQHWANEGLGSGAVTDYENYQLKPDYEPPSLFSDLQEAWPEMAGMWDSTFWAEANDDVKSKLDLIIKGNPDVTALKDLQKKWFGGGSEPKKKSDLPSDAQLEELADRLGFTGQYKDEAIAGWKAWSPEEWKSTVELIKGPKWSKKDDAWSKWIGQHTNDDNTFGDSPGPSLVSSGGPQFDADAFIQEYKGHYPDTTFGANELGTPEAAKNTLLGIIEESEEDGLPMFKEDYESEVDYLDDKNAWEADKALAQQLYDKWFGGGVAAAAAKSYVPSKAQIDQLVDMIGLSGPTKDQLVSQWMQWGPDEWKQNIDTVKGDAELFAPDDPWSKWVAEHVGDDGSFKLTHEDPGFQKWMKDKYKLGPTGIKHIVDNFDNIGEYLDEYQQHQAPQAPAPTKTFVGKPPKKSFSPNKFAEEFTELFPNVGLTGSNPAIKNPAAAKEFLAETIEIAKGTPHEEKAQAFYDQMFGEGAPDWYEKKPDWHPHRNRQPSSLDSPMFSADDRPMRENSGQAKELQYFFSPNDWNPESTSGARPNIRWDINDFEEDEVLPGMPTENRSVKLYRGEGIDLRHPDAAHIRDMLFGDHPSQLGYGKTKEKNQAQMRLPGMEDMHLDPQGNYMFEEDGDILPPDPYVNPELGPAIAEFWQRTRGKHIGPDKEDQGLGRHWTVAPSVTDSFSGGKGTTVDNLAVRFVSDWTGRGEDPYRTNTGGEFPDEKEITMIPGSPMNISDVQIQHPEQGWTSVWPEGLVKTHYSTKRGAITPHSEQIEALMLLARGPENLDFTNAFMEPYTDEEYQAHLQNVERINNEAVQRGLETYEAYRDEYGNWLPERADLHRQIIDDAWNELATNIPTNRQGMMIGGLPGAGKSTVMQNMGEIPGVGSTKDFLRIDPDYFKEQLVKRGLVPQVEGLSPLEASPLIHKETSHLADLLATRAFENGTNLAFDGTMRKLDTANGHLKEFEQYGYSKPHGLFVDIPLDASHQRAQQRHREAFEQHRVGNPKAPYGGRVVPADFINNSASSDPQYSSENRLNFETIRPQLGSAQVWDNSTIGAGGLFQPQRISNKGISSGIPVLL